MIECRGISKKFRDFAALDGVSLEARPGITTLLGPNGAGKSTLVKIMTGLLAPDAGLVRVGGIDVAARPIEVRKMIGVLPEDLGLFDSLTIAEHLELSGPIYGIPARETRDRAAALMRILKLDRARDTFLDRCSHGMRKKTALAMALLHNPRVVFLDEPFEGIDPVSARAIEEMLETIARRGVTVFLTSHILSIVDKLADEIVMIRGGRIVWQSTGAETRSIEQVYFELVEAPPAEDLPWLGAR